MEREFVLARESSSVGALNAALDQWLPVLGVPAPVVRALQVCFDELLANAIQHGDAAGGPITVRIRATDGLVKAQLRYRGPAFKPRLIGKTDVHTPVSSRDVGGLGIQLVRSLTDRFDYETRDGDHCLSLEKRYRF